MQPVGVRIGVNATVVLVLLLLAVPLQLFLNHYLEQTYTTTATDGLLGPSSKAAKKAVKEGRAKMEDEQEEGIDKVREKALERLGTTILLLMDQFQATFTHYSSWQNLKQLFVVPLKPSREKKTTKVHLSSLDAKHKKYVKVTTSVSSGKRSNSEDVNDESNSNKQIDTTLSSQSNSQVTKGKKGMEEASTSQAKEVEEYKMREVYFSRSKTPRTIRPSSVEFHVGQVVKHKLDGYYGVIIGWDSEAKAPDWWIDKVYGMYREHLIQTPHYHIIVDSHFDASGIPFHYIPSKDLELIESNMQISAPELERYFEGFRNHRHVLRPWLREIYPLD